jgi:hypothetical protein
VQPHANVVIDGRTVPLSLYLVSILESGGRKSAVDRAALAPHSEYERGLAARYRQERVTYDASLLAWQKAREEAAKKVKGSDGKRQALLEVGRRPEEPLQPQLTTDEPTYEGLVKLLAIGRPSLGLFSDEGGRFLGGYAMNPENRLKTLAGLSGLWDGQPITRTRAGEGSAVLYGRRVALHIMIQPVVAPSLLADPLALGQGFLSRCLISWPTSTMGQQRYAAENPAEDPRFVAYHRCLQGLLQYTLPTAEGDPRELRPRPLSLAPDAKDTWVRFHDWAQRHLGANGELHPIAPLAAKAAEHALRLAGLLAVLDDLSATLVHLHHLEAGIALARYYLEEGLRLHGAGATNRDLLEASALYQWLKTRGPCVALPDVYQYGPVGVRDKASALRLMGLLEHHGWVRRVKGCAEVNGVRRRDVWEVRL